MMAGFAGEISAISGKAALWKDPAALTVLAISGFVGMGVGYFGMETQRDVSATSFFVLQNASKVGVVLLGIIIFGDSISSAGANIGLLLSLGGSCVYGHAANQLKEQEKAEKQ